MSCQAVEEAGHKAFSQRLQTEVFHLQWTHQYTAPSTFFACTSVHVLYRVVVFSLWVACVPWKCVLFVTVKVYSWAGGPADCAILWKMEAGWTIYITLEQAAWRGCNICCIVNWLWMVNGPRSVLDAPSRKHWRVLAQEWSFPNWIWLRETIWITKVCHTM